jgi:ABC-type dipeptide/oligopeptide/nickel transport system permease subunit
MTLPDITLLLTVYAALPRGAGESRITATIVALLVGMWLPPYAKLVASRVRALDNAVFVRFSKMIGAHPLHTIRKDVLPHLREDLAWVLASAFPRFLHVELGLAYVGIDYRARGLGRLLKESYEHFSGGPYALQLCIVSATVVWIALLPQLAFRTLGVSLARGHGSE